MKIVVFDACNTLTKVNNTYEFLFYLFSKTNKKRLMSLHILKFFDQLFSILHLYKIRDTIRSISISLLKGYEVTEIDRIAEEYIDNIFKSELIYDDIFKQLIKKKKKKSCILSIWLHLSTDLCAS
jgi:phosphoserine phosphatase